MPGETVSSILLKLLAVGALVLLNGFFVAAELAMVKIRGTQLDTLVLKGHRRAKIARQLIRNLDAAISATQLDRKSTRLNSSHVSISYAVFCLKKKKRKYTRVKYKSK